MNSMRWYRWLLAGIFVLAGAALSAPAEAQEGTGTIEGTVFLDLNQNGVLDAGEPTLGNIQLEITDGETIHTITTGPDGTFSVPVGDGMWRAIIRLPDGLSVLNDATRQVEFGSELTREALMNFAVSAWNSALTYSQSLLQVQVISPEEGGAILLPDPSIEGEIIPDQDPGPASELQNSGSGDLLILPESGARLAPRLLVTLAAGAMLAAGVLMMLFGKRLDLGHEAN